MYSIMKSVSVGRDPTAAAEVLPDENPMCVRCTLFTGASTASALLTASAAGEVDTPSRRCTEDTIWSPSCALF